MSGGRAESGSFTYASDDATNRGGGRWRGAQVVKPESVEGDDPGGNRETFEDAKTVSVLGGRARGRRDVCRCCIRL